MAFTQNQFDFWVQLLPVVEDELSTMGVRLLTDHFALLNLDHFYNASFAYTRKQNSATATVPLAMGLKLSAPLPELAKSANSGLQLSLNTARIWQISRR